jgi:hypothetical protein
VTFDDLLAALPEEEDRRQLLAMAARWREAARARDDASRAAAAEEIVGRLRWHFRAARRRPLPTVRGVEALLAAYLGG